MTTEHKVTVKLTKEQEHTFRNWDASGLRARSEALHHLRQQMQKALGAEDGAQ